VIESPTRKLLSLLRRVATRHLLRARGQLLQWIVSLADTAGHVSWRDRPVLPDDAIEPQLVRKILDVGTVPRRTRLDVLLLYATRSWRRKPATLRLKQGRVYLDPQSLSSDWYTWYEIFSPHLAIYSSDYEDAVVVDVGAHKGYFAVYALLSGARAVRSYEPEARNFAMLQRAARSYGDGGRWLTRGAAVGATARRAELHVANGLSGSWSHSLLDRRGVSSEHSQAVGVVPMASTLREAAALDGRRLVVKIDAEGGECEIVLGTGLDSWKLVDEVLLEHHDFAPCELGEIVSHLGRAGLTRRGRRGHVEKFCRGAQ
jgi:FkbM family methyltransferase